MTGELRFLNPSTLSDPLGPYSHAVEVPAGARWLYLAGQVSVDELGEIVGRGDLLRQVQQVFGNLDRLLMAGGYGWADVVATRTYLTRKADVETYRSERSPFYERYFPFGVYPTSTLLVVERLAHEDFLLEIEAVAAR